MALLGLSSTGSASVGSAELTGVEPAAEPFFARWVEQTLSVVGRARERNWRDQIISALANARCPSVPLPLRNAAAQVRRHEDEPQSDRVLADAAATVLGPACVVSDVESTSQVLEVKCPLPARAGLELPGSVFGDVLVADYLVLNALATSFVARDEFDAKAKRLVMDFLLSAGLRGEHARETRGSRVKSPAGGQRPRPR
jgi:hypothetical protein